MYLRIANNCGITQIRDSLNTQVTVGTIGADFIEDLHTVRFKIRFKHLSYMYLMKISDESEDAIFIDAMKDRTEMECAYKIWRLNDKRVRHGLESWI